MYSKLKQFAISSFRYRNIKGSFQDCWDCDGHNKNEMSQINVNTILSLRVATLAVVATALKCQLNQFKRNVFRGKCTGANTKLIENENGSVEIMRSNDKNREKSETKLV